MDGTNRSRRLSWTFAAGLVMALGAVGLLGVTAERPGGVPILASGLAVMVAALFELMGGGSIVRRGGAGRSHLIVGAIALALALVRLALWWIDPQLSGPWLMALLLGVFCLSTAFACGLDLLLDQPREAEGFQADVSFVLAIIALHGWREATPSFVGAIIALQLLVSGVALAASASSVRRPVRALSGDLREG